MRGGDAGKRKEPHLGLQHLVVQLLLLQETLVLVIEVVEVLQVLLGKDVQELRVHRVRVGEGLDRGEDAKTLEVKSPRPVDDEDHLEGAQGDLLSLFRGNVVLVIGIESAQGLEKVLVCDLVLVGGFGGIGELDIQPLLVLLLGAPSLEPARDILESGLDGVEHVVHLDEAHDLHKDVESYGVIFGEKVEDGGQAAKCEVASVCGRGGDGLGEVLADGLEVFLGLFRMVDDSEDEQVVGGPKLLLWCRVQDRGGLYDRGEGFLSLSLLKQGLDLIADLDVVGNLLQDVVGAAIDENKTTGRHDGQMGNLFFFCFFALGFAVFGVAGREGGMGMGEGGRNGGEKGGRPFGKYCSTRCRPGFQVVGVEVFEQNQDPLLA